MRIEELKEKKIAILGLGVEGRALARYFLRHKIHFTIIDEKSRDNLFSLGQEWKDDIETFERRKIISLFEQSLDATDLSQFDVLFRSPGISLSRKSIQDGVQKGVTVSSQIKLFFDHCPGKIVGVTGTKGKGTTSSLIYEMLKTAGIDAYLGGNIGLAPISFLDVLTSKSVVVLELSSFQLEDLRKSPHVAVMLMVTSEHLDDFHKQNFHKNIQEYHEAKRNILRFQTVDNMAIINTDYEASRLSSYSTQSKVAFVSRYNPVDTGCFVRDSKIIFRDKGYEIEIIDISEILLPGGHNLENVCSAVMAAKKLGVGDVQIQTVLRTFKGLEHRLELVREVNGVRYYDDSFSTTPETAIAAIQAFPNPEILILGGSSKGSDFTELGKVISEIPNIKAIIGIGIEWQKIKATLRIQDLRFKIYEGVRNMKDIVAACPELSAPREVVLLSPACASFDMFKNYKDRGDQFKKQVNLL